jgi:hypothetical protein
MYHLQILGILSALETDVLMLSCLSSHEVHVKVCNPQLEWLK